MKKTFLLQKDYSKAYCKKTQGITLIALVVTIVVLLILAGITISLVFSENGIIAKAREAANKTNQAVINEQAQMNELSGYMENMLNGIDEEQTSTVQINCINEDGEYLEGVVIGIYLDKNNLIKQLIFDENTKGTISIDLPNGKYYISTIKAPDGYNLPETIEYVVEKNKTNVWNIEFAHGSILPGT